MWEPQDSNIDDRRGMGKASLQGAFTCDLELRLPFVYSRLTMRNSVVDDVERALTQHLKCSHVVSRTTVPKDANDAGHS